MAQFHKVNRQIKKQFPALDIEVIRGEGYVYFIGEDGYKLDSIMTHPTSTSTEDLIRMCVDEIESLVDL